MEDKMKYELSVEERILLFGILPQESDYRSMLEIKDFRTLITFNEEETRNYDITVLESPEGQMRVTFNKEAAVGHIKEYDISPRVAAVINEQLEKLDKERKVTDQLLGLFEKFLLPMIQPQIEAATPRGDKIISKKAQIKKEK
jgi:hypothetical protein